MRIKGIILGFTLLGALGACGDTLGEQALIGGGAGALAGVALDGDPVTGAIIGGAGNVAFCQMYPSQCR
jgi:hypothetical protein